MIVKRTNGYVLMSKSKGPNGKRTRLGGPYKTREEALKRQNQVEFFKSK